MAGKWTRDEEILAFALYCRVPFGKIHAHNPSIKALASMLDRTPASVSMKMCNFARFDSSIQLRGVIGLKNGSRLDEEVWAEFSTNLGLLEQKSKEIFQKFGQQEENIDEALLLPSGEDVEHISHIRLNQRFFRQAVLLSYKNTCCITGIAISELLCKSYQTLEGL